MAVSARTDNDRALPVTIDLHRSDAVRAGTFPWDGPDAVTGWHRHTYHQLEYALSGVADVETTAGRYLLPPQQAIWIPAGLAHCTTLRSVRSVSVFFEPAMLPASGDRALVLAAAPVIREMISYGLRWPITRRADDDERAHAYFGVLADLVVEWLDHELPLRIPTASDPLLADVLAYANENLATVTAAEACRAVGISERTLRRRLEDDVGMTWRAYLTQARLLRSMALLANEDCTVLDAAVAVGFASPSAFARAFHRCTGQTPSAYRRHVLAEQQPL